MGSIRSLPSGKNSTHQEWNHRNFSPGRKKSGFNRNHFDGDREASRRWQREVRIGTVRISTRAAARTGLDVELVFVGTAAKARALIFSGKVFAVRDLS
jgi:hypothetical protein